VWEQLPDEFDAVKDVIFLDEYLQAAALFMALNAGHNNSKSQYSTQNMAGHLKL
jgi:hypothetical protein